MGRFIDITGAPIASDFQEMPLDFMAKALSAKQASYDKQDLEAAALPGLFGEGFIATQGYKDILTKELNPKLSEWSKRAIADPEGVGRDITKYKSQLANDPRFRLLTADTAKKADYLKQKAEADKLGIPFEKAFDYKANKYKGPIDPDKLLKGEVAGDLEDFYGTPYYGNVNEEILKLTSNIKPITLSDVQESYGNITKFGDQLKNNKSIEISSNTLNDLTPVAYRLENGKEVPITIGELTSKKLMQVGSTWLAGNTVGSKYGRTEISPIMQAQGNTFEEKFMNYLENLYEPTTTYNRSNKSGFSTIGSNIYSVDINIPTDPKFNPWLSQNNTGRNFDEFIKTSTSSKTTRDASWQTLTNLKDGLISKTTINIPGLRRSTSGAYVDADIQSIINYWQSGKAMADLANQPTKLSEAKALYDAASTYQINDHQLKFYNNQITEAINKVYKEKTGKNAPEDVVKGITSGIQYVKANTGRKNQKTGEFIYENKKISPYLDDIQTQFKNGLNISQAYVLADKTGNYSKEGFGIATNIWDRASSGKIVFEGMGKENTATELGNLFRAKTGSIPQGTLTPKGVALDKDGRIITIVEDSKTGLTADFVYMPRPEDLAKTRDIYIDMSYSSDPMASSVGKQGLTESVLTTSGELYKWDNLTQSNSPISESILGLKITKEFDTLGNPVYSYTSKGNTFTSIGDKDLKTNLGTLLLTK
jgi:hypothetical protein